MEEIFSRTADLIGEKALKSLHNATVAVVGLGGVGGSVAEALLRAGIGTLILMDHDVVAETNINRQTFATVGAIGEKKCVAAAKRLSAIHNESELVTVDLFYSNETSEYLFALKPDFIVDAIDTVTSKLSLIATAKAKNVPIISCMGAGNRLDPTKFYIGDISETKGCGCGLARVMRRELRKREISLLPVVYSKETPRNVLSDTENGRHAPGSISFCPPVAGNILASYVVQQIMEDC